ncbi:MAG: hypothetical protein ACOYD3_13330, partial [Kiritimatiellia bacterium]
PKPEPAPKRGRRGKGEPPAPPPDPTRLQLQLNRDLRENLADLPTSCDWGARGWRMVSRRQHTPTLS